MHRRHEKEPKMKNHSIHVLIALLFAVAVTDGAPSHTKGRPVTARTPELKAGDYVWHPEVSPAGPVFVFVSLPDQLLYVYRNGVRIGRSTVSAGKPGKTTPTGVFTILQKKVDHESSIYKGAKMPHMQRLTWTGIALHAGYLPGYPASAGCVRLPVDFAAKLSIPNSSEALTLYNQAVADLAADVPTLIAHKKNFGMFELRDAGTGETVQLQIESGRPGEYQPDSFQKILKAASVNRKGLDENVTRPGVGGTVVGIQQSSPPLRLEPLKGYREPVTAVVDFPKLSRVPSARLRLFDPDKVSDVDLEGRRCSLSADFSAPLASYGRVNENWIGFLNMVRGERMRNGSGLLMMRPYDPTKIPVIFVHGLLSSS
jgi:L,D-transpeptidase-like protein